MGPVPGRGWKIDEAAMKAAIEAAGNEYISADAGASSQKQLNDIDALIAQGVDVLIINAWDKDAIGRPLRRPLRKVSRSSAMTA